MTGQSIVINRAMFDKGLVSDELAELNASIVAFQKTRPSPWAVSYTHLTLPTTPYV